MTESRRKCGKHIASERYFNALRTSLRQLRYLRRKAAKRKLLQRKKALRKKDISVTKRRRSEPKQYLGEISFCKLFVPLDNLEQKKYNALARILKRKNKSVLICNIFGIPLTAESLSTLLPRKWLNDEVINAYFKLLKEQISKTKRSLSCEFFSTFFLEKLLQDGCYNFSNVRRWLKRSSLRSCNLAFFPINIENYHWMLLVLHMNKKVIYLYDSSPLAVPQKLVKTIKAIFLRLIRDYFTYEGNQEASSGWVVKKPSKCPRQTNKDDCGVHVCMTGALLSKGLQINFQGKQTHICRKRILLELTAETKLVR